MTFNSKRVLVIGASGALGAEIAKRLMAQGAEVIGTCSTEASSQRLSADLQHRLILNLKDECSIQAVSAHLISQFDFLDGIINASGLVGFGTALETSTAQRLELLTVNHLGPASLYSQLHPLLVASGELEHSPFIAAINGLVAEKTFPGMSAYTASKVAAAAHLQTLALEWRRHKISVTDARPGHTETGLAGRAAFGTAPAFPAGMTSEHVAEVILNGIAEKKSLIASTDF